MDEFADFSSILAALLQDAGDPTKLQHETIEPIVTQLSRFTPLTKDARQILDVLQRDRELHMVDRGYYVYLKQIADGPKSIVPIASMDVDFNRDTPRFHFTACMLVLDDVKKLSAIGMRFETPEGRGGGAHDFHHAQLVREVGRHIALPNCPLWLPDHQPSFALDAADPVELLVCAITSIYGAKKIAQLRRYGEPIWTYANRMRLAPSLIPRT